MKKLLILAICEIVLISCSGLKTKEAKNKTVIHATINTWHKAASEANFEKYFSLMTDTGVFVGTDATENWQNDAFRSFSKPYFDKGKAWTYTPLQRNVYINKAQNTAWFDELLDNSHLKICRGSGVLIKKKGKWKIAHYVLSITIPNENVREVVKIKASVEDSMITTLKTK